MGEFRVLSSSFIFPLFLWLCLVLENIKEKWKEIKKKKLVVYDKFRGFFPFKIFNNFLTFTTSL